MIQGIGPLELAIVLVIVLLIFGPKRLPGLGRQLGSGMREFKDSITGKSKDESEDAAQPAAEPDTRASANTALGRPDAGREDRGEPVDGEVVSDRR
jgi:sec-independent protein translocase protein TatA